MVFVATNILFVRHVYDAISSDMHTSSVFIYIYCVYTCACDVVEWKKEWERNGMDCNVK